MSQGFFRAMGVTRRSPSTRKGRFSLQWPGQSKFKRKAGPGVFAAHACWVWGPMRETRCPRRSSPYYMNLATWSISCLRIKETRMENQCRTQAKFSVSAARKWNPKPGGELSQPLGDAKRPRTRLQPGPGHETIWPAPTLLAQTRLNRNKRSNPVVCSHWLVVDACLRRLRSPKHRGRAPPSRTPIPPSPEPDCGSYQAN